ncbi:MAG: 3-oxoacyl-ACP synthase [Verrucomicrobia bacterium]|nr:3-oxoacyl-ACP synthase [Verrucomicrobiota bacterium]
MAGTGSYLPDQVLTNADLEKMVETTDEWIVTRTGIRERRIAGENEATSDLAARAAQKALHKAGADPLDVDVIIVATITPDMVFPSTACFVQHKIGAKNAFCFDIEAACAGFLYGMEVAKGMISNGSIRTALVIGAEKLSCITDWQDRNTCVLFGDGAGAVVLKAKDGGHGLLSSAMGSDGALSNLLNLPAGGSRHPASKKTIDGGLHFMKMEGKEVFKHAVRCMADAGQQALRKAGLTMDHVKCIIPHQANMRIIQAISDKLGISMDRFYVNLDRVGNMSAASIPVALDEACQIERVRKGDIVLFVAFGGGFTWGAAVVEL